MKSFLLPSSLLRSFGELLYPRVCAGCGGESKPPLWLCDSCMDQVEPLEPWDRCRRCFAPDGAPVCGGCADAPWTARAALFSSQGLAARTIRQIGARPHPAALSLLASLFVLQWERLNWPTCHRLLPLGSSRWRRDGRLIRQLHRQIIQLWPQQAPRPGQRHGLLALHLDAPAPIDNDAASVYLLALLS